VLSFVASILLTRGLASVQQDMDDPTQPMVTTYGHCTQELMNLCVTGRAASNVHDGTISLGDEEDSVVLKGIERQPPIGYLSAFEALNQLRVGHFYKQPEWPIWIVGGPMHYTICFTTDCRLNHVEVPCAMEASTPSDGVCSPAVSQAGRCEVCARRFPGVSPSLEQLRGSKILYHFNGLEQTVESTGQTIRCPELRQFAVSAAAGGCGRSVAGSDDDPELFEVILRSRWQALELAGDGSGPVVAPCLN